MELSILIPARNEEFLGQTIEDILSNIEADTEIIVVLDGEWPNDSLPVHPRVTIVYNPEPIGQRAATNQAARLAKGKYVMKLDAHCAMDKGFDRKMIAEMHDDWTMVPTMKHLHVFDWVCPKGHRRYQSPSGPCKECDGETTKDIKWIVKESPKNISYAFSPEPKFNYFKEFAKRPEGKGDITPSLSLQGSCFMLTREKYFELDVCSEEFPSWGSQGIEVACKTWLSGGQVMVNKKTWYAHLFRTQGGDFSFPYSHSNNDTERAKEVARDLFFYGKWDKAVKPLSWLLEKFWPVREWTDEDLQRQKEREKPPTVGIVYYTDNAIDEKILKACQEQLKVAVNGKRIVSVSLKPLEFGDNITLALERGYLTMFKQILKGLEASTADIIFFAEHDVMYHPSHFEFTPPRRDMYYYNMNVWMVREDGLAITYDHKSLSGLCAYRDLLIKHFRERVRRVEEGGFSYKMGFEPGTHNRKERVDDYKAEGWRSEYPNIDIKHGKNLTKARWKQEEFRNKPENWQESTIDELPEWNGVREMIY